MSCITTEDILRDRDTKTQRDNRQRGRETKGQTGRRMDGRAIGQAGRHEKTARQLKYHPDKKPARLQ